MRATRFQQTLNRPCQVSGRGYWSGQPITLTFLPAKPYSGVRFVRTDMKDCPSIQALVEQRVDMPLRTRLSDGSAVVDMVEHVLAALLAMKIDNVEIHCTNCEMPGLDGSSHAYALALSAAGIRVQSVPRTTLTISDPIRIGNDQQWIMALPSEDSELTVEYRLDYGPNSPIGQSTYSSRIDELIFLNELACARTFITFAEAEQLQQRGLARHVTPRDLLVFNQDGPVDNSLRFVDECARHKALDLLGDLALAGMDIAGKIVASRSGHQLNGSLAQALRNQALRNTVNLDKRNIKVAS